MPHMKSSAVFEVPALNQRDTPHPLSVLTYIASINNVLDILIDGNFMHGTHTNYYNSNSLNSLTKEEKNQEI